MLEEVLMEFVLKEKEVLSLSTWFCCIFVIPVIFKDLSNQLTEDINLSTIMNYLQITTLARILKFK